MAARRLFTLFLLWLTGCTSQQVLLTRTASPIDLGNGVYLIQGSGEEVDTENLGRVGNAGFIVGNDGVVVIDTGTSYRHGQSILDTIAQVTDKPVKLVLITHTRQEFLFGSAAFREKGIPIYMHRSAAGLMVARCENCLKQLRRLLGENEMHGTTMFKPDRTFDESHDIDLIGRPLQIMYYGHSSGPGDIAVLDKTSGVLFAGGMLDNQRIPDVQDSDLPKWRAALSELRMTGAKTFVPGHGPPGQLDVIDSVDLYLEQLEMKIRDLLHAGIALSDVSEAADLPTFRNWRQYDTIHRRNASIVFLRLERESIFK